MELQHCIACSGVTVVPQSNAYVARLTASTARNIGLTNRTMPYVSCVRWLSQAHYHGQRTTMDHFKNKTARRIAHFDAWQVVRQIESDGISGPSLCDNFPIVCE